MPGSTLSSSATTLSTPCQRKMVRISCRMFCQYFFME